MIELEANDDVEEALHALPAIRDQLPVRLGCKRSLKPTAVRRPIHRPSNDGTVR